jgi:hypothetical protein
MMLENLHDFTVWSPNETKSNIEELVEFLKESNKLRFL